MVVKLKIIFINGHSRVWKCIVSIRIYTAWIVVPEVRKDNNKKKILSVVVVNSSVVREPAEDPG